MHNRINYLKAVSYIVTAIGVIVCFGWFMDIELLKTLLPGYAAMKFNTALSIMLLGISFYGVINNKWTILCKGLCWFVIIAGLAMLSQNVFSYNLGIDEWLVKDNNSLHSTYPGRPAPPTLFCIIMMGLAFLIVRADDIYFRKIAQNIFHAVTIVAFISVLGYLFQVPSFYNLTFLSSIALHTAIAFLMLSITATVVNPDLGFARLFMGNTSGSIVARRLFPWMFMVLLLLGLISIMVQQKQFVSPEFAIALYTSAFILVALFLIWNTSIKLDEINAQRIEAENNIVMLNHQLEEKVLMRTAELAEINKEMESFTYSVSHDLRGPLRNISAYTQMLEEEYGKLLDEEGRSYISMISQTTLKTGTLIENLLAFSKLGKQAISTSEINMQALVEEVWEELLWLREYHGQIKIHALPILQADKAMMKQVLINLISNALKYTAKTENPIIEIRVEEHTTETIFFIRDNGAGFDMKYIHKLFNVFERLHIASDFEGTGVGLAIVKKIITRHGGRVWAEGEKNKGACFYFSLPR